MTLQRIVFSCLIIFVLTHCTTDNSLQVREAEDARNIGEAYLSEGNYTKALEEFLIAEELNPNDYKLQYDMGFLYYQRGKTDLAIKYFKKAVQLKPDYAAAINSLGVVYIGLNDWDKAIAYFERLAGDLLYATPYYPLSNLGWAYYYKKEYQEAERYFHEALKLNPDFVPAMRGLGKIYFTLNRFDEALIVLERAARSSTNNADLFFDLAQVYEKLHQNDNAIKNYQRVIRLTPDSKQSIEAKQKIRLLQDG